MPKKKNARIVMFFSCPTFFCCRERQSAKHEMDYLTKAAMFPQADQDLDEDASSVTILAFCRFTR
jgi:hypothetical protein